MNFIKEESIYYHPNVSLTIDDERRVMSQSTSTYDLVFIQFTKYFGSYGSTHFPVGINPLYTKEAFKVYFDHINNNGFIYIYDNIFFQNHSFLLGLNFLKN